MKSIPNRRLLTVHDICTVLEVSEPTLRRMIARRAFPPSSYRGRRGTWRHDVVTAFVRGQLQRWLGERRWLLRYPLMRRHPRDTDAKVRKLLDEIDATEDRAFARAPLDEQIAIRRVRALSTFMSETLRDAERAAGRVFTSDERHRLMMSSITEFEARRKPVERH